MTDAERQRTAALARVAWLYYQEQMTQAEIGEKMGYSRPLVNRMLKEARDSGLVKISIKYDSFEELGLAELLVRKYGLHDALVARDPIDPALLHLALAQAAAPLLERLAQPGSVIGLGIGRALLRLPDVIECRSPLSCTFASLIGGLEFSSLASTHNFDVLNRLAAKAGGQSAYIPAPSFIEKEETRDAILEDPAVKRSLEFARSCKVAFFGVGELGRSSLLYRLGILSDHDLDDLLRLGAVGDVLGHFFGPDAREVDAGPNRRVVGLSMEDLRGVETPVLVAGGPEKVEAIRALLRGGLPKILVCDRSTAELLAADDALT